MRHANWTSSTSAWKNLYNTPSQRKRMIVNSSMDIECSTSPRRQQTILSSKVIFFNNDIGQKWIQRIRSLRLVIASSFLSSSSSSIDDSDLDRRFHHHSSILLFSCDGSKNHRTIYIHTYISVHAIPVYRIYLYIYSHPPPPKKSKPSSISISNESTCIYTYKNKKESIAYQNHIQYGIYIYIYCNLDLVSSSWCLLLFITATTTSAPSVVSIRKKNTQVNLYIYRIIHLYPASNDYHHYHYYYY